MTQHLLTVVLRVCLKLQTLTHQRASHCNEQCLFLCPCLDNVPVLGEIYWLLRRKLKLSTSNKLLIYKTILKPFWTYGIQLWGMASTSNIDILERSQSKALRTIVDTPRYVPNTVIRRDLQIPTVKEEICRYSSQYSACLSAHPNNLIVNLTELPDDRQLRRHLPNDLPTDF
jgi:hypothetical protein